MNDPFPGHRLLIEAEGVADASGLSLSPGALLVEVGPAGDAAEGVTREVVRLVAVGGPAEVRPLARRLGARTLTLDRRVLIPALANAHVHLDLTHIGPRPYDPAGGFAGWAEGVRAGRAATSEEIGASVQEGARRSLAGGVVAVGDIAGTMRIEAVDALRRSPLMGVSFLEFFGIGERQEGAAERLEELLRSRPDLLGPDGPVSTRRVRLGLQPHAPYSAGPALVARAVALAARYGLPLSTHLAESAAERQLRMACAGPLRDMLTRIGVWDERAEREFREERSYAQRLAPPSGGGGWLVAHVNDCPDETLEALRAARARVAYCPRSSAYFGYERDFGPHRYRDMLRAGIVVALGTDSIINVPVSEAQRLSTLDEMRFLRRRDGTDAATLLQMGTVNGALALGLDPRWFRFAGEGPREIAGVVAVEVNTASSGRSPLERVMDGTGAVELVAGDGGGGVA